MPSLKQSSSHPDRLSRLFSFLGSGCGSNLLTVTTGFCAVSSVFAIATGNIPLALVSGPAMVNAAWMAAEGPFAFQYHWQRIIGVSAVAAFLYGGSAAGVSLDQNTAYSPATQTYSAPRP